MTISKPIPFSQDSTMQRMTAERLAVTFISTSRGKIGRATMKLTIFTDKNVNRHWRIVSKTISSPVADYKSAAYALMFWQRSEIVLIAPSPSVKSHRIRGYRLTDARVSSTEEAHSLQTCATNSQKSAMRWASTSQRLFH